MTWCHPGSKRLKGKSQMYLEIMMVEFVWLFFFFVNGLYLTLWIGRKLCTRFGNGCPSTHLSQLQFNHLKRLLFTIHLPRSTSGPYRTGSQYFELRHQIKGHQRTSNTSITQQLDGLCRFGATSYLHPIPHRVLQCRSTRASASWPFHRSWTFSWSAFISTWSGWTWLGTRTWRAGQELGPGEGGSVLKPWCSILGTWNTNEHWTSWEFHAFPAKGAGSWSTYLPKIVWDRRTCQT